MNDRYLDKAKREDGDGWITGYYVYDYKHNRHLIITNAVACPNAGFKPARWEHSLVDYEIDPSTLCQCTGLKDKNGKLIWENDIVILPGEEEPRAIKWDEDTARYTIQNGDIVCDFDNYWSNELEVIGNTLRTEIN